MHFLYIQKSLSTIKCYFNFTFLDPDLHGYFRDPESA